MLSPLRTRRCALWTRRSRTASAMVGLAMTRASDPGNLAGDDSGATLMPAIDDLEEVAALVAPARCRSGLIHNGKPASQQRSSVRSIASLYGVVQVVIIIGMQVGLCELFWLPL